jgi:hypothetical protein
LQEIEAKQEGDKIEQSIGSLTAVQRPYVRTALRCLALQNGENDQIDDF